MLYFQYWIFKDNYSVIFWSSKKNITLLNQKTKETLNLFKSKWIYNFGDYQEKSHLKVYNSKNELYANIVPDEYLSKKEYFLDSNEIKSLLFIEDKDFIFRSITISIKGVLRSIYNIHTSKEISWASWITQQLVKNLLIKDNSRNLVRKYKELFISYYLEYNYSKIDILNEYLNRISYWKNIYWIQKAWEIYLWKKDKLSLEETFLLNSLLKKPTYFLENQDELKQRANYYISQYLKEKSYSLWQINKSKAVINNLSLNYNSQNQRIWDNQYLIDYILVNNKNNDVILNYDIPIEKEKEISNKVKEKTKELCEKYKACDIWIIVYWKDNKIKYLYGWDYSKSQVNIINSYLEVWSTLKPFIYLKYFEKFWFRNYVSNSKICVWEYCPNNWNFSFNDSVSLNTALNLSYNVPIVHIVKSSLWIDNVSELFYNLWLYKEKIKNPNYSFLFWTENIKFFDLIKAYSIFLHDWELQDFDYFGNNKNNSKKIFKNSDDIKKISQILKWNGYFPDLSIKTWTTTSFKDHYIIWFNDNYVFGIWIWNKNWEKTLAWDYSLKKWSEIVKILKENILDF